MKLSEEFARRNISLNRYTGLKYLQQNLYIY